MAELPDASVLLGDFRSTALDEVIHKYLEDIPPEDLPSDKILNTTILFLRALFYTLPSDHDYRWRGEIAGEEDEIETGIAIGTTYPIEAEVLERRPAVIVQMGPKRFSGLHVGQQLHYNQRDDIKVSHDLLVGTIVIVVLSENPSQARKLSDWIGIAFRLLSKYLTFGWRFQAIHDEIEWTGVQPAGDLVSGASKSDYYQSNVVIRYNWTWAGSVEAPDPALRLNRVRMTVVAYGRPPELDGAGEEGGIVDSVTQLVVIEATEESE